MKPLSNEEHIKLKVTEATSELLLTDRDQIHFYQEVFINRKKLSDVETKSMFNIHNYYMPHSDYGYWCGSCRQTVYKTLVKILPYIETEITQRNV